MQRSYVDYSRSDEPPVVPVVIVGLVLGMILFFTLLSANKTDKASPPKPTASATKPANKRPSPYVTCKGKIIDVHAARPHPKYDVGREELYVQIRDRLGRYIAFYVYATDDELLAVDNHVNLVMTDPDPDNEFRTREIVSITSLYNRPPAPKVGGQKTNGSF